MIFSGRVYRGILLLFSVALVSCQGLPTKFDGITAVQAGDATLVVSGCEGNLGRGYQVCRFVDGAPMDNEQITLVYPWGPTSMATNIRIRAGAKLINVQATSPTMKIKYSDIFSDKTFSRVYDGPIQILTKTLNRDGTFYDSIGYLFVIVLNKGYNRDAGEKLTKCQVLFDNLGGSTVECDK